MYGDEIPLLETAVITGRGWLKPVGNVALPARFRFTHEAGQNYRHYMEATFFGLPILKVNEHFLDGRGRLELPFKIRLRPMRPEDTALWLAEEYDSQSVRFLNYSMVLPKSEKDAAAFGERYAHFNNAGERILLRYAFHELRYQKYNIRCIEINEAMIRHAQRLGCQEEGRIRRHIYTNGRYYDELIFGLMREEFDKL